MKWTSCGLVAWMAGMACLANSACSSAPGRFEGATPGGDEAAVDSTARSLANEPVTLESLQQRVAQLEGKISTFNEKMIAQQATLDQFLVSQRTVVSGVVPHMAEGGGVAVQNVAVSQTASDPVVETYRKAAVLFDSERYADSVQAFSTFVQQYPDHLLAPAAQYHLAESYARQKDWKSAKPEYQKILVSYDRSSYVPEALRRLSECQPSTAPEGAAPAQDGEKLDAVPSAAACVEENNYKQMLLTMFPQSPPALELMRVRNSELKPAEPTVATVQEKPAETTAVEPKLLPLDPSPEEDMALIP